MGTNFRVGVALRFDLSHRAHHGRVVAISKGSAELGETALEPLLAEVHRDVTSKSHALVPVFRNEIARAEMEVMAHGPLDILDARELRFDAESKLTARECKIDRAPRERGLRSQANVGSPGTELEFAL